MKLPSLLQPVANDGCQSSSAKCPSDRIRPTPHRAWDQSICALTSPAAVGAGGLAGGGTERTLLLGNGTGHLQRQPWGQKSGGRTQPPPLPWSPRPPRLLRELEECGAGGRGGKGARGIAPWGGSESGVLPHTPARQRNPRLFWSDD